jgi:hypothetical protein
VEVVAMLHRHPKRNGFEVVTELVGAVTLGAFAVLLLKSVPALRRYIHMKRI